MQTMQIPARADVAAQDKWAIHDLFATDDDWRAALAAAKEEASPVFAEGKVSTHTAESARSSGNAAQNTAYAARETLAAAAK